MKYFLSAIFFLLSLSAAGYFLFAYISSQATEEAITEAPAWMIRSYPHYGLSFSYPSSYEFFSELPLEGEVTTLLETFVMYPATEYAAVRSGLVPGEWPPAIRVAVYADPRTEPEIVGTAAADLLAGFTIVGNITERTVLGVSALEFVSDGLYRADNIILAHEGFIFHISGEWVNEDDVQRRDMAQLVSTLELSIPIPRDEG